MAPPVFTGDQIDTPTTSLSTVPQASPQSQYWSHFFAQGAQAPTRAAIGFDTTNADQSRRWQDQLMQDLHRQAAGDPNSRAQQSLTQGYTDARQGQSALGAAARGTGGGAGLRAGALGAGSVQRGYAGDQRMLMTQEQQSAQTLLAQQLAQQRGQDAGQAQSMAANSLGNSTLNNAMSQFYTNGGIQGDVASQQLQADRARAQLGFDLEGKDIQSQLYNRFAGAAATGGATAAHFYGANQGGSGVDNTPVSDPNEWKPYPGQ